MMELHADDEAYNKHLTWKELGYSTSFKNLVDVASIDPRHRMAVKLAHNCSSQCDCGGKLRFE